MYSSFERKQIQKRRKYFARRSFSKHALKEKIIIGIVIVIFSLYAISLIYPFLYLILNSFKTSTDIMGEYDFWTGVRTDPNYFWLPKHFIWDNYRKAFQEFTVGSVKTTILQMFLNSILLSVGETVVSMAMTCSAAYILAKYQFKGSKLLYSIVLVASFVPSIASLPAIYQFMEDTKLMGTYIGMIILNAGAFGGSFLYIHSYFKVIPWSFAESAMMDGASDFRIFRQIMLPLAKNGVGTFTILRFLGFWNDYWYPQLFYKEHPTIAVGIAGINNPTNEIQFVCAVMVLAIVPVLIFYAIFQKKLMSNTVDGGLK